ncbi:MAG: DegT/DnrJ/EryC1/StrS family aminotransferase [Candidatus Latescibacterota bacterium]|nr:MAG: DegT/DnrJ/EryC1/StrS family aminotransferase [Candidatus Latescibacterota bacterium]
MASDRVPYVNLIAQHEPLKDELLAAVERVLDHGQFVLGPEVAQFENQFAELCGVEYAVGVSNGTVALVLAMQALGVGPGDEVITPPNSFLASTSSIVLAGASPVFVDVGEDYNIDSDLIEKAITPQTRAIMPVHLTGRPAQMNRILDIANRHNLHVIEDCAQSVGARYHDRPVGSFGAAGCFSLHPLKNLSAVGDGGVITTNDAGLCEWLRKARNHGLRNRDECEFWSQNARLDTIQAAMLLVKLQYLAGWTELRRDHAAYYQSELNGVVGVPVDKPHEHAVYHTFIIMSENRDELQSYLAKQGVETKIHYPIPIHRQKPAGGTGEMSFPVTESQTQRILSLPVYPELTDAQRQHVVKCIQRFFESGA